MPMVSLHTKMRIRKSHYKQLATTLHPTMKLKSWSAQTCEEVKQKQIDKEKKRNKTEKCTKTYNKHTHNSQSFCVKVLATKAANPTESRAQLVIDKALTLIYAQVKLYILFFIRGQYFILDVQRYGEDESINSPIFTKIQWNSEDDKDLQESSFVVRYSLY